MKKQMLRQLRNQFAVAVCVLAMSVQFILLENYINADVSREFGEFNNNFVWLYALFFALGGLICFLLRIRRQRNVKSEEEIPVKDHTDFALALWGIALIVVAFLSVGFVNALLPYVKIEDVTDALPLVYALILCASALTHYALFTRLFARVKEEGASLLAPICSGIVISMVALIVIPRQISYKAAIVLSGVLLILGAIVYAKREVAVSKKYEVRPVERTNDTSGALTFVLLGLMTFGITFLFVNIDFYADKLRFEDMEVYLLIGFCAGGAYVGNAFFKKFGRVSGLLSVIDFAVLSICLFTICFVREYVVIAALVLVASICFAVIVRDIIGNIKNWDKMRREGYKYLIIVAGFLVPLIMGYAGGTAATAGHGYMTDIFASVDERIAEYALRARGILPYADGTFAEYIGIGTRVRLSDMRFEYIPSRFLPLVPMACMLLGFVFYMISQIYNIRTGVNDTSKSKVNVSTKYFDDFVKAVQENAAANETTVDIADNDTAQNMSAQHADSEESRDKTKIVNATDGVVFEQIEDEEIVADELQDGSPDDFDESDGLQDDYDDVNS